MMVMVIAIAASNWITRLRSHQIQLFVLSLSITFRSVCTVLFSLDIFVRISDSFGFTIFTFCALAWL